MCVEKTEKGYVVCEKCFWLAMIAFCAMVCLISNLATQVYFMSKMERERDAKIAAFSAKLAERVARGSAMRQHRNDFGDPNFRGPDFRQPMDFAQERDFSRPGFGPMDHPSDAVLMRHNEMQRNGLMSAPRRFKKQGRAKIKATEVAPMPEMRADMHKMECAPMPPAERMEECLPSKDDKIKCAPCPEGFAPAADSGENVKATDATELFNKAVKTKP